MTPGGRPGRAAPGSGITLEARRLPAGGGGTPAGDFTYTVVLEPLRPEPAAGERRRTSRHRTRLRSAKIIDPAGVVVTDCLVHDLSARGGRLRLPPGIMLPRVIQIYDDQTGHLHRATVLWRRERDAGVAFEPPRDDARSRAMAEAARRRFQTGKG